VTASAKNRSFFISLLGWLGISFGSMMLLISIVQLVVWLVLMQSDDVQLAIYSFLFQEEVPEYAIIIVENLHYFIFSLFIFAVFLLLTSIGLLRRNNLCRYAFVFLLGCSVLYIAGTTIVNIYFNQMAVADMPEEGPEILVTVFSSVANIASIANVFFSLGISVLLIWAMVKLLGQKVRAEFLHS